MDSRSGTVSIKLAGVIMNQIPLPTVTSRLSSQHTVNRRKVHPRQEIEQAKLIRNLAWKSCQLIPAWVDHDEVGLDTFYTRPEVAKECSENLYAVMQEDYAVIDDYHFIDPGAGAGAFYDLMPRGRRIGIDILPTRPDFIRQDYLTWNPPSNYQRYAVLGNPPFGYRAWLALAFVNHSARFADYMGLILPMAFQSDGKGSPKHRVRGAELMQSRTLPPDAFVDESGRSVKLNALWQIWRRGVNNTPPPQTCNDWIDIFTVDIRKERLCGHNRVGEADYFLQRTYYGEPPKLVTDFADVRYGCGYGIVLKKEPETIAELLTATDWTEYSNLAMHNCRHISMYHIRQAVIHGGFTDE